MFSHIVTDGIKVSFVLGLLCVHHMFCFTKDVLLNKLEGGLMPSVMFWVRWKHLAGGDVAPFWGAAQHLHAERSHGLSKQEVDTCVGVRGSWVMGRTQANSQPLEVLGKKLPRGSGRTTWTLTQLRKALKVAGLRTSLGWRAGPERWSTQRGDGFSNLLACPEELSFLCFKSYKLESSRALK